MMLVNASGPCSQNQTMGEAASEVGRDPVHCSSCDN